MDAARKASTQSRPQDEAHMTAEVQRYSVPLNTNSNIGGQFNITHYDDFTQVSEPNITTRQGAHLTANYPQSGYKGQTSSRVQLGGYNHSALGNSQYHVIPYHNSGFTTWTDGAQITSHTSYPYPGHFVHNSGSHQIISGGGNSNTTYPITHMSHTVNGNVVSPSSNNIVAGSRVVTGEEHIIGYNTITGEERIISERIVEHEVKVPKKVVREEVIEKVIIVPETVVREEVIEEVQRVQETIIEVAKPIIQEKIIEVPEYEYRDKIIEKVEKVVLEKIREVPKVEVQERFFEIPKIITQEKIVEIPEIEYREIIVEKLVEIPEVRENVILKEVPVPQYVEKPIPEYVNTEVPFDVERNIPVPVEAITTFEYQLPQFRPRVCKVQYPLYVPRFVEVPVSAELFDIPVAAQLQENNNKLQSLSCGQAISLCEIENMATEFRHNDATFLQSTMDLQTALTNAWKSGRIATKENVDQFITTASIDPASMNAFSVNGRMMTYGRPVFTTTSTPMVVPAYAPLASHKHKKSSPSMKSGCY